MARSQQTFNKTEKEKLKKKKKEEKERRKEERKANPGSGDLESMLVYVDEEGNFTTTPPDPKKRTTIKAEDIELGIPKKEDSSEADEDRKGKVTFFNESKGYGFIRDQQSQESVFVHLSGLIDRVKEGDTVTFKTEKGPKGLNAIGVKKA